MFRQPLWLAAGLLVLPGAWALLLWAEARRRRVGEAIGSPSVLAGVVVGARRRVGSLRLAAVALLLVALAGPQFGVELVETRSDVRQTVVAVDVSLSMLAPDIKPSRLERAKASLSLLIDQLRGERIGVVAFAGDAQTICPLTQDADAAKQLLGALEAGAVPTPGTAVGAALRSAVAMLGRYPGGKAVILLTDGEDHKSDPLGAAREAAAAGVQVYTVGIGTPEGELIPGDGGTHHKDAKGATVVSRLDEDVLSRIARETGGAYYRTSPGSDEIADIAKRIRDLDAAKGVSGKTNLWRDRYAWPATAAFLLLLLELLLPLLPARTARAAALVPLLLAAASPSRAATAESELRAGNRLYGKEKYEAALDRYGSSAAKNPKDPRGAFNAGDALYRLQKLEDATAMYESVAARKDVPPATRAAALYNLGNARFTAGDFPGAAAAFRSALALSPRDEDARRNLAVAMNRIKRPPPPQKNKKPDPKKDGPKPPDDKQDKPKDGGGGGEPPKSPPRSRPQDSLTKEEAERILRAVNEREKQSQRQAQEGMSRRAQGKPPTAEDW